MFKDLTLYLTLAFIAIQFTGGFRAVERNIPSAVCLDLKPVFADQDARDCPGEIGTLVRFSSIGALSGRDQSKSIFDRNDRNKAPASHSRIDNDIAKRLCIDGYLEVASQKSRADCVTDAYAIEVERTDKFKEALGQALVYGSQNRKIAMIYLYCASEERESDCAQNSDVLQETIFRLGLPIRFKEFRERDVMMHASPAN
jgi:hypothetical protein